MSWRFMPRRLSSRRIISSILFLREEAKCNPYKNDNALEVLAEYLQ
ncbi:MAG: hypothetical protein LBF51_06630 [Zoogloeaceae bacterium]|jgi:hypothetical protein|nr:hypothetical protein [Zoogloeaceae bacterium]